MKMKMKIHLNSQALLYAAMLLLFADRIEKDSDKRPPPTVIVINTVPAVSKGHTGKTGDVAPVPGGRSSDKIGCQK